MTIWRLLFLTIATSALSLHASVVFPMNNFGDSDDEIGNTEEDPFFEEMVRQEKAQISSLKRMMNLDREAMIKRGEYPSDEWRRSWEMIIKNASKRKNNVIKSINHFHGGEANILTVIAGVDNKLMRYLSNRDFLSNSEIGFFLIIHRELIQISNSLNSEIYEMLDDCSELSLFIQLLSSIINNLNRFLNNNRTDELVQKLFIEIKKLSEKISSWGAKHS